MNESDHFPEPVFSIGQPFDSTNEALPDGLAMKTTLRQSQRYTTLLSIANQLTNCASLNDLLETSLFSLTQALHVRHGCLFLAERPGKDMHLLSSYGSGKELLQAYQSLGLEDGLTATAASTGEPVVVDDLFSQARTAGFPVTAGSFVASPIKLRGITIGVIDLFAELPNHFSKADLELVEAIGSQLGTAVGLYKLEDSRRTSEESPIASMFDTGPYISALVQGDSRKLAERIAEEGRSLLGARLCLLTLSAEVAYGKAVTAFVAEPGMTVEQIEPAMTAALVLCDTVVAQREITHIRADEVESMRVIAERVGWPFTNVLGIPLIARSGASLGVFLLLDKIDGGDFSDSDERAVNLFSSQASMAVENAMLFGGLKRRADRIGAINKIQEIINSSLEVSDVFEAFTVELRKLVDCDVVSISVLDRSAGETSVVALSGVNSAESIKAMRLPLEGSSMQWVYENRVPQIESDLAQEQAFADDPFLSSVGIRSAIRLPLLSKGKVIGTLNINSHHPNHYMLSDADVLESVTKGLGTAIENSLLYNETKRQQEEAAFLAEASRLFNSSLEIEAVLRTVTQMMADQLKADGCTIWLKRGDDRLEIVANYHGDPKEALLRKRFSALRVTRVGEGATGKVASTGQPIILSDRGQASTPSLSIEQIAMGPYLAVPIASRDNVLGVIGVSRNRAKARFKETDLNLAQALAHRAASAIENARLFSEVSQRVQELSSMQEVVSAVASRKDFSDVLNLIVEKAAYIAGAEGASICLLSKDRLTRTYVAVLGKPAEILRDRTIGAYIGIHGWVIEHGEPAIIDDINLDHRTNPDFLNRVDMQSLIVLPLHADGLVIGCLAVFDKRGGNPFSEEDLRAATLFSRQAAVAIDNARLYQQTQSDLQTKTLLLNEINHRVRNNLAAIYGMLSMEYHQRDGDLRESVWKMLGRVQSMASVHSLLSSEHQGQVDLVELARTVVSLVIEQQQSESRHVEAGVSGKPVFVSAKQGTDISLVLNELICNTIEHGFGERTELKVRLEIWEDKGKVWLMYSDNGEGLPPGFELDSASGLGLKIIESLVEKDLGGYFQVFAGEGTKVHIAFASREDSVPQAD